MHRTTVMLPSELKQKAVRKSHEMGVSLGEFVRLSLRDELERQERSSNDPLFADAEVFQGQAPEDAASSHDDLLYGSSQ